MRFENLIVVGLNHMTAAVPCREKLAVAKDDQVAVLRELFARADLREAVLLSTCSRLEFYGIADDPAAASRVLRDWFSARGGAEVSSGVYAKNGLEALQHLFRVTAGLDSWIIGETEIQGQVRRAYQQAVEQGLTAAGLNRAFQSALAAGKAVRAKTGIQTGINSIGGAAATLAHRIFPGGKGGRVVVFGSGEAAEAVVRHLAAKNFSEIWVANRTLEKARAVAEPLGGKACGFEEGLRLLAGAQAGVFSVGAPKAVLTPAVLEPILAGRGVPLFLLDLGLPRNIEQSCASMAGVHLHDLDHLKELVRESMEKKAQEKARAEELVKESAEDCAIEMIKSPAPPQAPISAREAAWNAP